MQYQLEGGINEEDFTTSSIPRYVDKDHPCLVLLSQSNSLPSNPVYIAFKKRMESFTLWPPTHIHQPADLAAAGFFYAGYADCVRCYQCGLGLKSWRPGDDIHEQHKKFRPYCPFLRIKEQAAHSY
ncbi:baculoviral IAP repeat-containing protein 7-like [Physella acuta]|uniref:baculoviral IAP repeat-containing protein 7-like n=1 Tax=Physella acuta TaxID=109671 RepID=UPI0027DBA2DA|nr:baculoviral IAP repeat-containing protein 7-like [Physella acuta]